MFVFLIFTRLRAKFKGRGALKFFRPCATNGALPEEGRQRFLGRKSRGEEVPMKRSWLAACLLLGLAAWLPAQDGFKRFELGLFGGYGLTRFQAGSVYSAEWSADLLQSVKEETVISVKSKNASTLGGSLAYFFTPNIGLQLSGATFSPDVTTNGSFTFRTTFAGASEVQEDHAWTGGGTMNTTPLSLDVVGRYALGAVEVYGSAGVTLFRNSFEADNFIGWGSTFEFVWYVWVDQYVDAFQIPIRIEKTSWTAFGGNLGAGVSFRVIPALGLFVDGRYFYCPARELGWKWQAGTYTGLNNPYGYFTSWEITDADLASSQKVMTTLKVNPSFFSVTAGFKVCIQP
jgi:hypothetical protein